MKRELWWESEADALAGAVFATVEEVEREQAILFDRFIKLAALYDQERETDWTTRQPKALVSENVIASNVDTVTAVIATAGVRPRLMTDDADWSTQRRARHQEWYATGLAKIAGVQPCAEEAFKGGALKGTGVVKVYPEVEEGEVCAENVAIDDIIVDERECRTPGSEPRTLHQRVFTSRSSILARFPGKRDELELVRSGQRPFFSRFWRDQGRLGSDEIVVIESWRLPCGRAGKPGYEPGRHTICAEHVVLLDEEWSKEYFPFAFFFWAKRSEGWYGCGLAQRIVGHQRQLNRLNWQIDQQQHRLAVPITYVQMPDANLAVKTYNPVGSLVPYKGARPPQTVIPPAVSGETYQRRSELRDSAYEETGLSRMAAAARKPAGIESGVALREYRDQTTQRFALQEKAYERFYLRIVWLLLAAAKELGPKAPVIAHRRSFGKALLRWRDVDLDQVALQLEAASTLSRTPAGRTQLVMEFAQAGVVSLDEARRLLRHPDLEHTLSLYTAALEDIERVIEDLLDGQDLVPEPFQNLKMGVWRVQQAYLRARGDGAPEEILERMRQWIVQATHVLSTLQPPMAEEPVPAQMGAPDAAGAPPM